MSEQTLDALATRLALVERQNRRLKRFLGAFCILALLAIGWLGYHTILNPWVPGMWTQGIHFYNGQPLSFGEIVELTAKGSFTLDDNRGFRGGISSNMKVDHMGREVDYTGLFLTNDHRNRAFLSVSGRGAFLQLEDAKNAVYLGPGMYDDGQLLLELVSQDGEQGLRLGLNSDQEPIFEVIREGKAASVLDGSASTRSLSQTLNPIPIHDVAHE